MASEVIMPALGMTQDTGKLVKWYKNVGDTVSSTEILMEVETDKSAMEIEAGSNGVLTAVFAEAGEDVPVGKVIAVISTERETVVDSSAIRSTTETKIDNQNSPQKQKFREHEQPEPTMPGIVSHNRVAETTKTISRKILASPKAKSEAERRKVRLSELKAEGYKDPILYSHIQKYTEEKKLSTNKVSDGNADRLKEDVAAPFSCLTLVAEVNGERFFEMTETLGLSDCYSCLLCSMVTGAYRISSRDFHSSLAVKITTDKETLGVLVNPDQLGFKEVGLKDKNVSQVHDIVVVDLTKSIIGAASPSVVEVPEIWITKKEIGKQRMLSFTMVFRDDRISYREAVNFLEETVKRVQVPLYHLV